MIKLKEIANSAGSFGKLASQDFDIVTAYKIKKLAGILQKELDLYNEQKENVAKKYGTMSDDEKYYHIAEDKIEEANKELEQLAEYEVEIQYDIPLEIAIDSNIKLSANDIILLEPFVNFVEGDENG